MQTLYSDDDLTIHTRLVNGDVPSEGYVEMFYGSQYIGNYICDFLFDVNVISFATWKDLYHVNIYK